METTITIEGTSLNNLIEYVSRLSNGGAYRLRIAVDDGDLKLKINEDVWTPPLGIAKVSAS